MLTAIPLLLQSSGHCAVECLNFIGANCSPKESVIALQESLGRLAVSLASEGGSDKIENDSRDEDEEDKEQGVTAISQLVRIMDVYTFGESSRFLTPDLTNVNVYVNSSTKITQT